MIRGSLATLSVTVLGCTGPADVAASSAGDYDPRKPPRLLELTGELGAHDPTLFQDETGYQVFYSGDGLRTKRSKDLMAFEEGPSVFAKNPGWIAQQVPDATALWSPTVGRFGGVWHLYYAASVFGTERSCIGHATASSLSSGFQDQGFVVCSNVTNAQEDFNAIDPSLFVDDDESAWLAFGSFGSGIKLIALDGSGEPKTTTRHDLAARSAGNPAIQASSLTKRGQYYYLWVSFDSCCAGADSTHNIRVGRSLAVTGPYIDKDSVPLLDGGGTLVLESGPRFRGPGSNMIFEEGLTRYNVYHAYDADSNGQPTLRIAELAFDNDGWPISAGP